MFKELKTFWECFFTALVLKGIYNFWKVRGVIYGFNNSRSHISSGVVKTFDDSMSVIRFRNTPKDDLPRYSYILRNPYPLRM